jgi:hypothetical protein
MYNDAGGHLAFGNSNTIGSTERMRIDSSGNVGIGTSSPVALSNQTSLTINGTSVGRLDLQGTGQLYANSTEIVLQGSYGKPVAIDAGTNQHISFRYATSEKMRIDSSGNVGIGTSSPTTKLQVEGTLAVRSSSSQYFNDSSNANNLTMTDSKAHFNFDGTDKDFQVSSDNLSHALFVRGSDGKVGIGTSSPSNQLHLQKSADNGVVIENTTGATLSLLATGAGRVRSSGTLIFDTGGSTERMRIDSSGNLLVGTTSTALNTSNSESGHNLFDSGYTVHSRSGQTVMSVNRLSNDGSIVDFRKDGTVVGKIFTKGNELCIGQHDTNIRFLDSSDSIIPVHSAGDGRNDSISLGTNGARFKNGYFSGSLYGDGSNLTGVGGSTTRGDVGTYTVGATSNSNSTAIAAGATAAGNTLVTDYYSFYHQRPLATDFNGSTSCGLSGTWRNMGGTATGAQFGVKSPTLWVRIS